MTRNHVFIGIDPGVNGGVAWIVESAIYGGQDVNVFCEACNMPDTPHELAAMLESLLPEDGWAHCYLEKISGPCMFGDRKAGIQSSWKFGRSVGIVQGVLAGVGVPFEEVAATKWQAAMGCRTGGDKRVSKAQAQRLFPAQRPTLKTADALLLAELCRRERRSPTDIPAPRRSE